MERVQFMLRFAQAVLSNSQLSDKKQSLADAMAKANKHESACKQSMTDMIQRLAEAQREKNSDNEEEDDDGEGSESEEDNSENGAEEMEMSSTLQAIVSQKRKAAAVPKPKPKAKTGGGGGVAGSSKASGTGGSGGSVRSGGLGSTKVAPPALMLSTPQSKGASSASDQVGGGDDSGQSKPRRGRPPKD